jgi:hypothetical protein
VGYVFGRRERKTHGQLMREELSEGFGHLGQAAAHGLDSTMAAFAPLLLAARTGAATVTTKARIKAGKKESGMSRRRTTLLVGLLAAGVAAGAAGAMMARRRNRAKWDEYEQRGIQAARQGAKSTLDTAQSTVDEGAQGTDGPAATKETANLFADQAAPSSKNSRN